VTVEVKDKQRAAATEVEEKPGRSLPHSRRRKHDRGLWLIALFKLMKAALLVVVAIGALKLIHDDVAQTVSGWVAAIRIDPENRFIHRLFVKLAQIDDRKLEAISAGSFFYAALLAVEGIGLWMEKRWAEYLTVIATASFIPLEIYELVERLTVTRVLLLAFNIGVVIYLIMKLRERNGKSLH
jgi:uncharacterized membrane protein (DUF2068 family)